MKFTELPNGELLDVWLPLEEPPGTLDTLRGLQGRTLDLDRVKVRRCSWECAKELYGVLRELCGVSPSEPYVACLALQGVTRVIVESDVGPEKWKFGLRAVRLTVDAIWLELACAECGQTLHGFGQCVCGESQVWTS